MFERFRQNLNDLIRTDKPESPTDLIFITGSLMIMGLMIYATQTGKTIPGFEVYLGALATYKTVKAVSDYKKGKGADNAGADQPEG